MSVWFKWSLLFLCCHDFPEKEQYEINLRCIYSPLPDSIYDIFPKVEYFSASSHSENQVFVSTQRKTESGLNVYPYNNLTILAIQIKHADEHAGSIYSL